MAIQSDALLGFVHAVVDETLDVSDITDAAYANTTQCAALVIENDKGDGTNAVCDFFSVLDLTSALVYGGSDNRVWRPFLYSLDIAVHVLKIFEVGQFIATCDAA